MLMATFMKYLEERFLNLLPQHQDEKKKHAEHVFGMLQKAYEPIGGIHGSGFTSPEDMVRNIPFWKLHKNPQGKVVAATMYKDKGGRKMVAFGGDGSAEGRSALAHVAKTDIHRSNSYGEISDKALKFYKQQLGDMRPHAMKHEEVAKMLPHDVIRHPPQDDPEMLAHPELKDHFYQRQIGGDWHTKLMVGTTGKKIA
jgi:hypothetical protein